MQTPWLFCLILNPELRIQAHPNHCSKAAAKYFSLVLGSYKPEQSPPVIPYGPSHWNMQCLLVPQGNVRSILRARWGPGLTELGIAHTTPAKRIISFPIGDAKAVSLARLWKYIHAGLALKLTCSLCSPGSHLAVMVRVSCLWLSSPLQPCCLWIFLSWTCSTCLCQTSLAGQYLAKTRSRICNTMIHPHSNPFQQFVVEHTNGKSHLWFQCLSPRPGQPVRYHKMSASAKTSKSLWGRYR